MTLIYLSLVRIARKCVGGVNIKISWSRTKNPNCSNNMNENLNCQKVDQLVILQA